MYDVMKDDPLSVQMIFIGIILSLHCRTMIVPSDTTRIQMFLDVKSTTCKSSLDAGIYRHVSY